MRAHEDNVIPTCAALDIGFLAYSPLGRGMLTGTLTKDAVRGADDFRSVPPMFQGDTFDKNRALVGELERIAEARGVKTSQIALAWVLSRGDHIVPIPGTRRIEYLEENVAATALALTDAELAKITGIFAPARVAGERWRGSLEPR